jgi:hypothetical protein
MIKNLKISKIIFFEIHYPHKKGKFIKKLIPSNKNLVNG